VIELGSHFPAKAGFHFELPPRERERKEIHEMSRIREREIQVLREAVRLEVTLLQAGAAL